MEAAINPFQVSAVPELNTLVGAWEALFKTPTTHKFKY